MQWNAPWLQYLLQICYLASSLATLNSQMPTAAFLHSWTHVWSMTMPLCGLSSYLLRVRTSVMWTRRGIWIYCYYLNICFQLLVSSLDKTCSEIFFCQRQTIWHTRYFKTALSCVLTIWDRSYYILKRLLGQKKAVLLCFANISVNSAELLTTIGCLHWMWFICCCLFIGEVNKLICLKVISISLWYMASSVKISHSALGMVPKLVCSESWGCRWKIRILSPWKLLTSFHYHNSQSVVWVHTDVLAMKISARATIFFF